jgi:hypothetical protein
LCGSIKGVFQLAGYTAVQELYTEVFQAGRKKLPMYAEIFFPLGHDSRWCGV